MFYIIGRIFTKDNTIRVIDTSDKVVTDISESELVQMIKEGTIIENGDVTGDRLVTKPYELEKYGFLGEELTYTVIGESDEGFIICSQDGKIVNVTEQELIRVSLVYSLTNLCLEDVGNMNYIKSDIKYYQTIPLNLLDNKTVMEGTIEVGKDIWVNIMLNGFSYRVLLKSCCNRTKDYKYYFGVLEAFEMEEMFSFLESQEDGIGELPYLGILVEYSVENKKFTKGVCSLNMDKSTLYRPVILKNCKVKMGYCIVLEDGIKSYTRILDMSKGEYYNGLRRKTKV